MLSVMLVQHFKLEYYKLVLMSLCSILILRFQLAETLHSVPAQVPPEHAMSTSPVWERIPSVLATAPLVTRLVSSPAATKSFSTRPSRTRTLAGYRSSPACPMLSALSRGTGVFIAVGRILERGRRRVKSS